MSRRWVFFIPVMLFVLLSFFFWRGLSLDPQEMPSALIGKAFPAFSLTSLVDQKMVLQRKDVIGKVSLVNVWASWCVSCRYEHPVLNQLAEQGVRIIGINYRDEADAARRWLSELGNPYEMVLYDRQGKLGLDLGVFGAPETYLIDHMGVIHYKHVGILEQELWRSVVQPLYQQLLSFEK